MEVRPEHFVDWDNPQWHWPAWKFGMLMEVMFDDLYPKFNTAPWGILNPGAFHHDVTDCATRASTIDELHALLNERQQQRIKELREAWDRIAPKIIWNPSNLPEDIWWSAVRFARHPTLDTLIEHFEALLPAKYFPEVQMPPNCSAMPPFAPKSPPADPDPRRAPSEAPPIVEELPGTPSPDAEAAPQSPKPPPQPTVQMRDAATQTEPRVTKNKAKAPARRTGASRRKPTAAAASSRPEDLPSAERYSLRPRISGGVVKVRSPEPPASAARAKGSTRGRAGGKNKKARK